MSIVLRLFAIYLVSLLASTQAFAQSKSIVKYTGINIAGAEFNANRKNAKHFKDYIWPTDKNLVEIKQFGFNTIRVPFAWERMQPMNFNPLNPDETKQLDRIVQKAHMLGLYVVLDPHSYGHYKGKVLQPNKLDIGTFSDLWTRLAKRYGSYPNVIFGLMNEPHKQTAKDWAKFAQSGIDAIRNTGADQLILVPGTRWSGMHSWLKGGENSNASALVNIKDPLDNYAYEMHQYFDADSSGTHHGLDYKCITPKQVRAKFKHTTNWLKKNNKKAFLGEFGIQENESCLSAMKTALDYIEANRSNWVGWTYWTAGDWMAKYPFAIFSNKIPAQKRLELIQSAIK